MRFSSFKGLPNNMSGVYAKSHILFSVLKLKQNLHYVTPDVRGNIRYRAELPGLKTVSWFNNLV